MRDLEVEQMQPMLSPKARGAWHLHVTAVAVPLEAHLLYSSVGSGLGNVGQTNYAAANSYLDELARHRTASGLPCVSVQWPVASSSMMCCR